MRRHPTRFFAPADPPAPATPPPGVQPPSDPPPAQTPVPAAPPTPPPAAPPPTPAPPTPPPAAPPAPPATPPAAPPPATPPAPQAPARYELALPANGPLDQTDLDLVSTMGKERGWSNDQAQAVLNDMATSLTAQRQAFLTELEAHPTLGGAQLAATQQLATRALDRFLPATTSAGATLRSVLTKSGYGNFAPFVEFVAAVGAAMGEDRPLNAPPGGPAPERKPTTEVMFAGTTPK